MSKKAIANRALTPPMGWNSWDCFGTNVTETEFRATAEFMAKKLKSFGWEYIVIDLGWYAPGINNENYKNENIPMLIDSFGRLVPDPVKFPSSVNGEGFKPLADYIHSLGLKFGIHIMRGIPWKAVEQKSPIIGTTLTADEISYPDEQCPWFKSMHTLNFGIEQTQSYYDSIIELYSDWGVDFVKVDDINAWHETNKSSGSPTGEGSPYRVDDIEAIAKAIDNCGRDIVLSISPGGPETTLVNHLRNHCNMWRISADFWDEWGSLKTQMDRCAMWAPFIEDGHWPDADMLPLGDLPRGEAGGTDRKTNFSRDEQRTLISLWSIFRSPLFFGGNLLKCDEFTLSLLTNEEVLAVNQKSKNNRIVVDSDETKIWVADSIEGFKYVAVFNTSNESRSIKIDLDVLGLVGQLLIRDLWAKSDIGKCIEAFSTTVAAHGASLLHLRYIDSD